MILGEFRALVSGSCVGLLADRWEGLFGVGLCIRGSVSGLVIVIIIVLREWFGEVFITNSSIFAVNVNVFAVETKVVIP